MCAVEAEVCQVKATMGPVESGCGDLGDVISSANTKRLGSEPPSPEQATLELPKPIKEEEDDALLYLTTLFDLATLDDSEDSDSESGSEDDTPLSPRPKGFENKFCFYASGCLHYFDENRRVYSENGALVYEVSPDFQEDLLSPSFYIAGVPYWFDQEGLLSQDVDGSFLRVHMWLSAPANSAEPNLLDLDDLLGQPLLPQVEVTTFEPNLSSGSFYDAGPTPLSMPAHDSYLTPKAKAESLSPNVDPNALQQGFQEGAKTLLWSPTSSNYKSPIISTASMSSRESSEAPQPSLFTNSSPAISTIPIITKWKQDVVQAQHDAERARPVKKPSKEERRRCPECNKLFRRPSSLDDHLNVHSGQKPHTCPFTGCNTGFATKSNMKRHFVTHRVGQLERYRPGMTYQGEPDDVKPTKVGKAPRAPTATYNSKSYHNGRFRIST